MEIYLIRHTAPEIAKGICYGQHDLPLAEDFEAAVVGIKAQLPSFTTDRHIFTSPLLRCSRLAAALFPQCSIIQDSRLKELDFGKWEMQAWNDIPKEELDPWMGDFVHVPCPGGESYLQLYARCVEFLEFLKNQNISKAIIITHAGPIRALHSHVHQIDLQDSFSLKVNYGDIIKLTL